MAYLAGNEIKHTRNGDVEIRLTIPYEHRDLATRLGDAFGVPLSVDIEVWQPYADAIANG